MSPTVRRRVRFPIPESHDVDVSGPAPSEVLSRASGPILRQPAFRPWPGRGELTRRDAREPTIKAGADDHGRGRSRELSEESEAESSASG